MKVHGAIDRYIKRTRAPELCHECCLPMEGGRFVKVLYADDLHVGPDDPMPPFMGSDYIFAPICGACYLKLTTRI